MAESTTPQPLLRQRFCGLVACRQMFTICVGCDRGQRYCSPACRAAARRQQRSQANRRYQQSADGREAHRKCQRRYRERSGGGVTDQGGVSITSPETETGTPPRALRVCIRCGVEGRWFDTSPQLPGEWRRRRRLKQYARMRRLQARVLSRPITASAGVQNSTFFDDR